MDKFTVRNLEIYGGQNAQSVSLLDIIDKTLSPMGSRTLRRWLALPLTNLERIQKRHQIVSYFSENTEIQEKYKRTTQKK